VDLDALPLREVKQFDAQYEGEFHYRGVPLAALIAQLGPAPTFDLVILHFANGIRVPLPFREPSVMDRLQPFVARAMATSAGSPLERGRFPLMTKRQEGYVDLHPLVFSGNRLVVADRWHPYVPDAARHAFSPWALVDTLVGLEFTEAAMYEEELGLTLGAPHSPVRLGAARFRETCQFCHAVRGVGGAFGWDFLEPEPIYSDSWMAHFHSGYGDYLGRRDPVNDLYAHLVFRLSDDGQRLMPALRYLKKADVEALWTWLKAAAARRPADRD
jgi:mono/diheme cytochrome c family protein